MLRLTTLGVGAMNSPRYAPAGLLVERGPHRVMIDGGPGAAPEGALDAWLVTDEQAELMADLRRLARELGLQPAAAAFTAGDLSLTPRPVEHTNHPAFAYEIVCRGKRAV